ncbi:unnamed protein product [Urochloa humidicola]
MCEPSSLAAVQELWNVWEIHCLILVSLFLQVFLFLFAGLRRRSSSSILRTVLWLAYLSADSLATFVLGHLAVHASEPNHQLMSLWTPFMLIHLGGQDTITAFSKQDNELWRRHLLSLVTQTAVAGYIVTRAPWPDHRLKAAMVLMFLSGILKYAGRTLCLYLASPTRLRTNALVKLSLKQAMQLRQRGDRTGLTRVVASTSMVETIDMMSKGSSGPSDQLFQKANMITAEILTVPINDARKVTLAAEDLLQVTLAEFLSREDRHNAYDHVGALLVHCYRLLYTKSPLREGFVGSLESVLDYLFPSNHPLLMIILFLLSALLLMLYTIFPYVSTPVAMVLFTAALRGDQLQINRADAIVSYILLVGAIVLDVSSAAIFMFSHFFNLPTGILYLANYIKPACSRKQWSEELGQYSMVKRHTKEGTACMSSIWLWCGWDVTHIPITKDHTPIKEFILDSLLQLGTRKQWNCASTRGQLALQIWMDRHTYPVSASPAKALEKIITGNIDFPTSALIWHIATDICYYSGSVASSNSDKVNKHRQMSRELSNYIMYLVFKCGVMLTSNSQLVHDEAHHEIGFILSNYRDQHEMAQILLDQQDQQVIIGEKDAIMRVFEAKKDHMSNLLQGTHALNSPVLPHACAVAQELLTIMDETERSELLATVWLEMLYYTAPRCGGAFHYEHLSTGGEFVTHVLLLMYYLGPFMPPPDA